MPIKVIGKIGRYWIIKDQDGLYYGTMNTRTYRLTGDKIATIVTSHKMTLEHLVDFVRS